MSKKSLKNFIAEQDLNYWIAVNLFNYKFCKYEDLDSDEQDEVKMDAMDEFGEYSEYKTQAYWIRTGSYSPIPISNFTPTSDKYEAFRCVDIIKKFSDNQIISKAAYKKFCQQIADQLFKDPNKFCWRICLEIKNMWEKENIAHMRKILNG